MITASARLLDLTRLVSRLGRGALTGIDRVELAYLQHLLSRPEPLFGLVRTAVGFVLLDKAGVLGVQDRLLGQVPLGKADLMARLTRGRSVLRGRAEAGVRRLAIARCVPVRLNAMLRAVLPRGTIYVNVGHANLTDRIMRAVKSLPGGSTLVMIHDTIPLDYPQFCRAEIPAKFAKKLAVVSAYADLVVHSAHSTKAQTERHFARLGRVPPSVVAPLGVGIRPPEEQRSGQTRRPYYVALGTIEPRKNVGLLVKIWAELQKGACPVPHLYIVGNRGWAEPALFDELDALAAKGAVTLRHDLCDGSVTALLQGAEALLFPSFAEGYGLPPLEAAALGVKVVAAKLPVVVEMLGDYPVYADTSDVYAWVKIINDQMRCRRRGYDVERQIRTAPNWADHFAIVFNKA